VFMTRTKSSVKKRFAIGANVRVIMPGETGFVVRLDDEPTVFGEYWHVVRTKRGERREPGSNLELIPEAITNTKFKVRNNMAAYDEALAQQILLALQEVFPIKQSCAELKARPSFTDVPEEQWLLTLDALLKLGMIDGKALRAGYQSSLHAAANLEITPLGRQSLSDSGIQTGGVLASHVSSQTNAKILVTIGRECFEAGYLGSGDSGGRDGVLYRFRLRDLLKDRGERLVSLFRTGTDRVSIENYEARIATVRLNVLRRAFDSGTLSFDAPFDSDKYHELPLRASDFQPQPQKKADDETIRRFIKFGAYCLAFRFAPNRSNVYADFDCPEDLDYLRVKSDDIGRNIWFLTEKDYVRSSSVGTNGRPLKCSPTSKLIDEIESGNSLDSRQLIGAALTQNFHLHGHNSRINVNSTDNSMNVASVSNEKTFVQIREAAQSIVDESEREKILAHIAELESTKGSEGFLPAYKTFMSVIADHMTVFAPFLPVLAQMLSGH
jgi:hypothetical protein